MEKIDLDRYKEIGGSIDLKTAVDWTTNYRLANPGETISQLFGRNIIDKILSQKECLGIRMYYANSNRLTNNQRFWLSVSNFIKKKIAHIKEEQHIILVGVSPSQNFQGGLTDQIPENTSNNSKVQNLNVTQIIAMATEEAFVMGEQSWPCPDSPNCPQNKLSS